MSFSPPKEYRGQIDWGNGITRGLVAALRFTEGGGTTVFDIARRRYHGTFYNTPTWSFGPRGRAIAFSGTAGIQFQTIPPSSEPPGGSILGMTIVCLGMTTSSGNQAFVTIGDSGGTGYFGLGINSVTPYSYVSGGGLAPTGASLGATNVWCHMAATYSATQRLIYQNGLLKGTTVSGWSPVTATSRADIGAFGNAGSSLQGRIDHVYIFVRLLNPGEIQSLYEDPDCILYRPRKFLSTVPPPASTGAGAFTFADISISGAGTIVNPTSGAGAFTFAGITVSGAGTIVNPPLALKFRGDPIIIVPHEPDWTKDVGLRVTHRTGVFEALDVSEERLQQFARPLYGISYSATLRTAKEQGSLRKQFELAKAQPAAVPLWPEKVELTAPALAGANTLTITDPANTLLNRFAYAILWQDWETWEPVQISSVTGTTVTLDRILAGSWPAGTWLVPLPLGFAKRSDFPALSAQAAGVQIEFDEVFNRDLNQFTLLENWDYSSCGVSLTAAGNFVSGGGDTFDCYPDITVPDNGALDQNGYNPIALEGGTGISTWVQGNTTFAIQGDAFDKYAAQADPLTETLAHGDGIGTWITGDL